MLNNSENFKPKILSLDFELQGVFDLEFVQSWICEAAGGYPEDAKDGEVIPSTINKQPNPWKHGNKNQEFDYDSKKAKLAAQNGLTDNEHVVANRDAVGEWIQAVTNGKTVWLGQNFRAHDWQFIKSLTRLSTEGINQLYKPKERPPIIDTMELSLLLHPEAKAIALRKDYKVVSSGAGAAQVDAVEEEKVSTNQPHIDAKNAYERACVKSQFSTGESKDGGLLCLLKSHPLKSILDQILLRDAPHSDWCKKDWQAVNHWNSGECKTETTKATGEEIFEDLNKILDCECQKNRVTCQLCSTKNGSSPKSLFKSEFCSYLDKEPFACAYFVCWLAKVSGTGMEDCPWKDGCYKFSPHAWIAKNYPAVLHLIRLYFADEFETPPTQKSDRSTLLGWWYQFSPTAEREKRKFKGRYIEVPAAIKKTGESVDYTGPKFEPASLEGAPDTDEKPAFGIHQEDFISRILGLKFKNEPNSEFSPSHIFVAPTGFGKSLCYQLPAFIMARAWKALTVVISPLQALQMDQVQGMKSGNPDIRVLNTESYGVKGSADAPLGAGNEASDQKPPLTVAFYNSSLKSAERTLIRQAVVSGECDMLFIAPEQLVNPGMVKLLSARDIGLVALDEAHCLSAWGQAFRPEYMYIAKWLDGYCQDRLNRVKHGLKRSADANTTAATGNNSTTQDAPIPLTRGLENLSWKSYQEVKTSGPYSPFPRAALFTATLEPEATNQLRELFLPGEPNEAADHIIGGYAPRDEINIEIYPDALKPFQHLGPKEAVENKDDIYSLFETNNQRQRAKFARRLGVLCEFLLEKFPESEKRLYELPVLIYSTTIKQSELVFGKPATMAHPWGLAPILQQLPLGIATILWDKAAKLVAPENKEPLTLTLEKDGKSTSEWKPDGYKDLLELVDWRKTTMEFPIDAKDGAGKHWKSNADKHHPEHEVYHWVLSGYKDSEKLEAHKVGLLLGLMADDAIFCKAFTVTGLDAPTIKDCFLSSEQLTAKHFHHRRVAIYHGEMRVQDRQKIMKDFLRGGLADPSQDNNDANSPPNLILCTNAFGMGVDRGDICSVILLGMPGSLNDLLQQAGRAKRKKEEMQKTLGLNGTQDPKARAIILTHTEADAQLHRFMLLQSRIRAEHLERVWRTIQSTHSRMKGLVQSACNGSPNKKTTDRFTPNPIENCFALDKITVSLADLRREWANVQGEDSDTDLLTNRSKRIEAKYGLHDLDQWDESMDQRMRQCLYWLERLGYIERMPNCPRVAAYELNTTTQVPPWPNDEVTNLKADIDTLFGSKEKEGWCKDFKLPEATFKEWRNRSAGVPPETNSSQETLRKEYREQEGKDKRTEIMRQWTKLLQDKLCPIFETSQPACTDPMECEVEALPDCLPFKSKSMRYILHPLLIQKLRQTSEPTFWDAQHIYHEAQDMLQFLNSSKPETDASAPTEADFESYRNARQLFTTLRRLGWVTDHSKITLVVSDSAKVRAFLEAIHVRLEKFLAADIVERTKILQNRDTDEASRVDSNCLIGYLTLTGAIRGITDQGHAQQAATEGEYVTKVTELSECLKSWFKTNLTGTDPLIIEISLKDEANSLKDAVIALRAFDPLYRYDAQGLVTAFIGWLQHWQRDQILVQEGNGLLSQAYTLRIRSEEGQEDRSPLASSHEYFVNNAEKERDKRFPDDQQYSAICRQISEIEGFIEQLTPSNEKVDRLSKLLEAFKEQWESDYGKTDTNIPKPPGNEEVHAFEDYNLAFVFQNELDALAEKYNKSKPPRLSNFPAYKRRGSLASCLLEDAFEYSLAQVRFLTDQYIQTKDDQGKITSNQPDLKKLAQSYYDPKKNVVRDLMSREHMRLWAMQEVRGETGELILPKPSYAQQKFVKDSDPFSFLEAGPGTGKTATLIRKLLWLVTVEGVPAEKIAFISFNVAVAKSIKRKVKATALALGCHELNKVFIGTCHAFMRKMQNSVTSTAEGNPDEQLKKMIEKMETALAKVPYVVEISILEKKYYIGALGKTGDSNVYIAEKNGSQKLEYKEKALISKETELAAKVFENTGENIKIANAIRDFCFGRNQNLLQHLKDCASAVVRRDVDFDFNISHLLIDEVQDIADKNSKGAGIGQFLRMLVHWGRDFDGGLKTVIAVGDPDQGIYEYNGGKGEFLRDFNKLAEAPQNDDVFTKFVTITK